MDDKGDHGAASTPGHGGADRGTTFRRTDDGVVVFVHNGDKEQVLAAVGLTVADLFDAPRTIYRYSDGRNVTRCYRKEKKTFAQSGNTAGRALFNIENLPDDPDALVYVVEGEKDVIAAKSVGVYAISQAQGARTDPGRADWSSLRGRRVVVVADKDDVGRARAEAVGKHLAGIAVSVQVAAARVGKDLADHIAAGLPVSELVTVAGAVRPGRLLKVTKGSQVQVKRVKWVVPDWIPAGSLTLLAGREGLGKSTIAASLCAQVTRGTLEGGEWAGTPKNILYVHTEDAREYTVVPRLKAAGADVDRVLFIDVQTESTDTGMLVLPLDTHALERVIIDHEIALVVLDAATSAMSTELSGKDDRAVRQYLEPLAQLAARCDCVILGLCHFGKREGADTGKLILGSIAWSQVARSVLSVARDEDSGNLVVTNTKANLAPRIRSMEAEISSVTIRTEDGDAEIGVLRWLGESDRDARELLGGSDDGDAEPERTEGEAWLEDFLTERGSTAAKQVKAEARKQGIAERTLKRAAKKLGVVYTTSGFPRTSHWALPAQSGQQGHAQPMHGPTGPTGLTASDQGKQAGPTGANPQSGHARVDGPTGPASPVTTLLGIGTTDTMPCCPVCGSENPDPAADVTFVCARCVRSGDFPTTCAVCRRSLPRKYRFDRHHGCRTPTTGVA
ncbi:AAA family ATPase [Nocardia terpenica]|uniref:AAA family ATPase n=1 Tax=Nocardia terpenica TaxID=455432 RepID=UPI002B4AE5FF|nr:AAA family ATPase [Nocardia terpenica]